MGVEPGRICLGQHEIPLEIDTPVDSPAPNPAKQ